MTNEQKRGASAMDSRDDQSKKRSKGWKSQITKTFSQSLDIQPGDAGIFATCPLKKEPKCVAELKSLFTEYQERLYPNSTQNPTTSDSDALGNDLNAEIEAEIKEMQAPTKARTFVNIRLDIPCVLFIKTQKPVAPVAFVKQICEDAMQTGEKKTRFTQRLSPMEVMGHASVTSLENTARAALAPHFHAEGTEPRKFAIRPSIRHHGRILSRDLVIKTVADVVGTRHQVDLKNYDLLILVEVYKNVCGVSVVDAEFERLKRFNLAEIYEPGSGHTEPKDEKSQQKET